MLPHSSKVYIVAKIQLSGSSGATRLLLRDGGVVELYGDSTVGPFPMSGPEIKNGSSSAKDGAPQRLICGTIQEEVS